MGRYISCTHRRQVLYDALYDTIYDMLYDKLSNQLHYKALSISQFIYDMLYAIMRDTYLCAIGQTLCTRYFGSLDSYANYFA